MYSSRGSNPYGQQQQQSSYAAQSAYGQNVASAYSAGSVGGPDGASQISMASRHASILGGTHEADASAYRAQYGGQYSSVYGSAALSAAQQAPSMGGKVAGSSSLDVRGGYGSGLPDSPKFSSADYVPSSSHGYGTKADQLYAEKISDYSSIDRRQYGDRQSAYAGRDLPSETTGRYAGSIGFSHQHQPDMYDHQALLLRQEQMLKAQSLPSATLEGASRQADYLAARGATIRHPAQDLMSYGGRIDADARGLSTLSGTSYGGKHNASILGAVPNRNEDDLVYEQNSSNPGYGVSLPPGRDYATGKGLHGTALELDYPGSMLSRSGLPKVDERKDDRGGYSRELERREEERRREHLREREKDREREKERERERDRERERERDRLRERKRVLERQEKERDRERKRAAESRRERTPPRPSKDRRGTSLTKDVRSLRRDSPRYEASHRRHSPVKEKRREYVCKVYSSSLVNVERDYLSINKRYPRLFTFPECSKVVVNWPRENLKLSLHTPVSFEHDFADEETATERKEPLAQLSVDEPVKSEHGATVWNAKMILMSGLSQNALEELSSDRSYDERIPHYCNILRFAFLRKDHSLMAIGGPWDTVDGGDPSVDESALIQTVLRYAKDLTQLDLKNCQHWNRFLEIHYDRVGKNGLFSHKEITVLYVPDLSECLPSLDTWRVQWLANRKAIAEREHALALKKEKSREKKEGIPDKEIDGKKGDKKADKPERKKEVASSVQAVVEVSKKEKEGTPGKKEDNEKDKKKIVKKDGGDDIGGQSDKTEKKVEQEGNGGVQTAGVVKSGKKKVIKRIIKQKVVVNKKNDSETPTKQIDKPDESEKNAQQDESSTTPGNVKTFTRKKIVKKVPVLKTPKKEDEIIQPEVKTDKQIEGAEDKLKGTSESNTKADVVPEAGVKTTIKKKIIKRIPKKKVTGAETKEGVAATSAKDGNKDENMVVQTGNDSTTVVDTNTPMTDVKLEKDVIHKTEKQDDVGNNSGKLLKKVNKDKDDKSGTGSKMEIDTEKGGHSSGKEKLTDQKQKSDKDGSRSKANKDVKERNKFEEPPRHPGLFLQTKGRKDYRLRSLSVSLDSLLDYTDKDIEESTFELSLFAETVYEMLQYQMGCRLLTFLQKLRIKFVAKRNQRKRQREENAVKESEMKSSAKRVKNGDGTKDSTKTGTEDVAANPTDNNPDEDGKTVVAKPDEDKNSVVVVKKEEENTTSFEVVNVKTEEVTDDEDPEEEDPEEDPEEEEDEDMMDASTNEALSQDEKAEGIKTDTESGKVVESNEPPQETANKETADGKQKQPKLGGGEGREEKVAVVAEAEKKEALGALDKELLQAFRFFDRNRAGFIRVEDMRLIIHNLGMFLSHRDVKELVQSALLESNTGRDDRIIYEKLLRISDI